MAYTDKIALLDLIRKVGLEDGDVDFLKEGLKILTQAVMDVEVSHSSAQNGTNVVECPLAIHTIFTIVIRLFTT